MDDTSSNGDGLRRRGDVDPANGGSCRPGATAASASAGGFSYDAPAGWTAGDASKISYGQAVLTTTPDPGALTRSA